MIRHIFAMRMCIKQRAGSRCKIESVYTRFRLDAIDSKSQSIWQKNLRVYLCLSFLPLLLYLTLISHHCQFHSEGQTKWEKWRINEVLRYEGCWNFLEFVETVNFTRKDKWTICLKVDQLQIEIECGKFDSRNIEDDRTATCSVFCQVIYAKYQTCKFEWWNEWNKVETGCLQDINVVV